MAPRSIFISAGDPSGDNACSHLITSLKQSYPDLELRGLGGVRMKQLGQKQLADSEQLAVLGFWEVAKRFLFFRQLLNDCVREIEQSRPAVVVLADYPGFNLRLAKRIQGFGIPVVYYISPQIWAWKKNRIHQIKQIVDLTLLILPFETGIYEAYDAPHRMVGHYLLEDIPREYINSPPPENAQIAILPGSRPQEVERMLEPMLHAVKIMQETLDISAVVAGVRGAHDYESAIAKTGVKNVTVEYGNSRRVVHDSRFVLCASGTATLECGLIGRPMVVIYRTGCITYQIARRLVKLDRIALVNLVLNEMAVPELIQDDASPERIAHEALKLIQNRDRFDAMTTRLKLVSERLGGPGASRRAADAIGAFL